MLTASQIRDLRLKAKEGTGVEEECRWVEWGVGFEASGEYGRSGSDDSASKAYTISYIQCCTLLQLPPPPEDDAAAPAVHGAPDNLRHTRVGRQTVTQCTQHNITRVDDV